MAYTFKHGDRPLDDFTIQRAVGAGGFGEVYYALSDGGREVALKYLRDNPHIELRGVSHCINLKSPHLISIFDVKKNADGEYFVIMEYCSGPSLRDLLIAEPNGFGPEKAAFFVREIAKGLSYLHDRGIVHRDLKPGNISYDDGYVKIGDYGLSKFISVSRHSAQTASVGTVHYMAPEIGSGEYSRGIDIYALGVMLYEMLMGKVPFEGSSMGEVLMKHLTAQPAVDQLPAPFAKVIRKALEKDPKDRYQDVNEMVDELLNVESVQKSLAGFSEKSLEGAVRRGGADAAHSPMPSPNPPPQFANNFPSPHAGPRPFGASVGDGAPPPPLPEKFARKMDRISRKIDRKMSKLSGKKGRWLSRERSAERASSPGTEGRIAQAGAVVPIQDRRKRILLSAILTVILSVAMGVIVGNTVSAEVGAAAWMMTMALPGMIVLSRSVISWFGVAAGPMWAQRLLRAFVCAGPMAIAAAPALDSRYSEQALPVYLGLLIVATFGKWDRIFGERHHGELRLGSAIYCGLGAALVTMLVGLPFDCEPDAHVPLAGLTALAATLILQSTAWWLRELGEPRRPNGPWWEKPVPAVDAGAQLAAAPDVATPAMDATEPSPHPNAVPWVPQAGAPQVQAAEPPQPVGPPRRWGITRAFWGLLAFAFMSGAIVTGMIPLIQPQACERETTEFIIACIGSIAAAVFCIRKSTPFKRESFWRESIRPFVASLALFGMGATATVMFRHLHSLKHDQPLPALLFAGLIVSTIVLSATMSSGSKRRRPTEYQPFIQPTGSDAPDQAQVAVADAKQSTPPTPQGEQAS